MPEKNATASRDDSGATTNDTGGPRRSDRKRKAEALIPNEPEASTSLVNIEESEEPLYFTHHETGVNKLLNRLYC